MKKLILAVSLSCLLTPGFAANQLLKNGQPVAQENVKNGEQISAMTIVISNYRQFKQEWDYTSFEHKPKATLAERAKVGDTVHLVTFFSNCLPDEEAKCNMSFKVKVFRDDNLILESPKTDYKLSYPGENSMQLSNLVLGSNFEANETGKYRYEVTVTDENADDTLVINTRLLVINK